MFHRRSLSFAVLILAMSGFSAAAQDIPNLVGTWKGTGYAVHIGSNPYRVAQGPGPNFPENGIVWDLNYRGPLQLIRQAREQCARRHLHIHDGWRYFLHGWAHALSSILHRDLTGETFESLVHIADALYPSRIEDG